MKLLPLTVRVNAAAPAVMDDGVSELTDGIGFGASKLPPLPMPDSMIAARARMLMNAYGPRLRQGVPATGAIDPIAEPRRLACVATKVGIRALARRLGMFV